MRPLPRFSIGSWAFSFGPFAQDPWSFDRVCRYAADAGYDGIEINGFRPHPHPDDYASAARTTELKHYLDGLGLGISGYAPSLVNVPPAIVATEAYLAELEKSLVFCDRLGIRLLRIDTISPPGEFSAAEYNRRWTHLARTWRAAAERADHFGIDIVWEFEPGFWLNKPSEIKAIVAAVDHPRFKVLFDSSHAYLCAVIGARQAGEREVLADGVEGLARLLAGSIGHVHFIDSDGSLHNEETSAHLPFGAGHINCSSVLAALGSDLDPLRWWCLDFCFCPSTERDGREAIPFMRQRAEARV